MAKFVWYVVYLADGRVEGTNDTEKLQTSGLWEDEDCVVIHTDSGSFVDPETGLGNREIPPISFGPEAEENAGDRSGDDD